jgi:hypothetical protein
VALRRPANQFGVSMNVRESTGIAIGIAIGVAIGVAMDNLTMGIGIGLAIAIAMGLVFKARRGT